MLRAGPALVRRARQSTAFLCCFVSWSEGRLRESPSLKWMRRVEFRVPRNNPRLLFLTLRQLWLRGPRPGKPSCGWALCGRRASPIAWLLVWRSGFPVCGSETSSQVLAPHTPLPSPALPPPWSCCQESRACSRLGNCSLSAHSTFHMFKERSL